MKIIRLLSLIIGFILVAPSKEYLYDFNNQKLDKIVDILNATGASISYESSYGKNYVAYHIKTNDFNEVINHIIQCNIGYKLYTSENGSQSLTSGLLFSQKRFNNITLAGEDIKKMLLTLGFRFELRIMGIGERPNLFKGMSLNMNTENTVRDFLNMIVDKNTQLLCWRTRKWNSSKIYHLDFLFKSNVLNTYLYEQSRHKALTARLDIKVSDLVKVGELLTNSINKELNRDPATKIHHSDLLSIYKLSIVQLDAECVSELGLLTNLVELHIKDSILDNIQLSGNVNAMLQNLHINNCDLSNIDIAQGFSFLKYLDVSHNKIKILKPLPTLSLVSVDLSHNNITSIEKWKKHKRLEVVLDGNPLSEEDRTWFRHPKN